MTSVHRSLVLALGDEQCTRELGDAETMPPAAWAAGVERVRAARYGMLPRWEAWRRLGHDMAQRLIHADESRLLLESMRLLPLQRAFASVVVPIAERLRRPLELDFLPTPDGGVVVVRGSIVLHPAVWQGSFEGLIAEIRGRWSVALLQLGPQRIALLITRY